MWLTNKKSLKRILFIGEMMKNNVILEYCFPPPATWVGRGKYENVMTFIGTIIVINRFSF